MAAEPLPHALPRDPGGDPSPPGETGARSSGPRRADRQGRVVQSLAHKVTRPCRRNGCPAPARASMVLDYAGKQVTLVPLLEERDPRFLEVCPTHAAGMDVPRGWELVDERDEEPLAPTGPPTPAEMGSSATVAVLAAALREPDGTPEATRPDPALAATEPWASSAPEVPPMAPSGRTAQPASVDDRQLLLGDPGDPGTDPATDRGDDPAYPGAPAPRPVPAAREQRRAEGA